MKDVHKKESNAPGARQSDGNQTWARRDFLALAGLAAAGTLVGGHGQPIMAGPFEDENEYLKTIPIDKKLDPAWIASLSIRGTKETYSDPVSLRHIGMPIGGLFAGTVYLSGDGRLWLWDIFNRDQEGILQRPVPDPHGLAHASECRNGLNYLNPAPVTSPFDAGFTLHFGDSKYPLDLDGFANVTFDGRYPIGYVTYGDSKCPVRVKLEAFSPFIPLDADNSSLPATVMSYTIENISAKPIECRMTGRMENAICLYHRNALGRRFNHVEQSDHMTVLNFLAAETIEDGPARSEILFEDFEAPTYAHWTADGTAFGKGPVETTHIPDYQGNVQGKGERVVNSHAAAPGQNVGEKDSATGTLTSKPFTIQRRYIHFLIGGGAHQGQTCINLLIAGEVVASATGHNSNSMGPASFNVAKYEGQQAQLQIVDQGTGSWGNVGIDHIVFSDEPMPSMELSALYDFGSMALALLGRTDRDYTDNPNPAGTLDERLTSQIGRTVWLKPGERQTVTFVIAWYFPNFYSRGCGDALVGHHYASRFNSAADVARYVAVHFDRLANTTRRWVETWYDSSLPYWLLDRTMANTSTLATTTCYRFKDGRFWAWEGIGCCTGTCTHVWHYAQAPGRLFPEIERDTRERVDFGLALKEDGSIGHRATLDQVWEAADDGQCGRILGAYREHQMSADNAFLNRNWPNIQRAIQYMIRKDGNADGMIEGPQPNTLDAAWYGKISFLASLYLAMLRAGQQMATEMGDNRFAEQCRAIADRGAVSILETWNGEYFTQIEDPNKLDQIGSGPGCYIDQVFGQFWAHQVHLGRLFDRDKQLSALRALWKYNFVPDVGPFREKFTKGRWYATAGDAGLLMCTWPQGGQNPDIQKHWQAMYFNECMSGFEWQAASHMVAEGYDQPDLLQYGLAIGRAIHDRYNASRRNPYNEIECSDHYARAMASYGLFLAVCGYQYHGPKGRIGFAPRLAPENFKCAFTGAEGWGSFTQNYSGSQWHATLDIQWGQLRLKSLEVILPDHQSASSITAKTDGKMIEVQLQQDHGRCMIDLKEEIVITEGQCFEVIIE
ncbi:MAG: hypothetical protein JW829_01130 [Pirellulales bacterium]|nr:hypothetical protein [Pirellulales bacterium]